MKIVYLEKFTFSGSDPDAYHWHGNLYCDWDSPKSIALEHELTAREVKILNKAGDRFQWCKGMSTRRFFSEEQLQAAAVEQWKELVPEGEILLDGDIWDDGTVCFVLDGPEEIRAEANKIWEEIQLNPNMSVSEKVKLTVKWNKLVMER